MWSNPRSSWIYELFIYHWVHFKDNICQFHALKVAPKRPKNILNQTYFMHKINILTIFGKKLNFSCHVVRSVVLWNLSFKKQSSFRHNFPKKGSQLSRRHLLILHVAQHTLRIFCGFPSTIVTALSNNLVSQQTRQSEALLSTYHNKSMLSCYV